MNYLHLIVVQEDLDQLINNMPKSYIYKNRNNDEITFTLLDDDSTCEITGYNPTWVRAGYVDEKDEQIKSKDLFTKQKIQFVDFSGGPFVALFFNLKDFVCTEQEFLKSTESFVIKEIKIEGSKTILSYDKKELKRKEK